MTKDPTLYKLIREGRDMHRYVGSYVLDCKEEEISDKKRKELKAANFALVYGGTDWNLTQYMGLSENFAKQVYETFWTLFPTARLWADNQMKILDANAFRKEDGTLWSFYKGITGRKFFFKAYPEKVSKFCSDNRIYTPKGFKYSEGMNYQVQSFCTADVHMIALGILFRQAIKHRNKFLIINTVHDSVLIDCKKEFLKETCNLIKSSLESVIERLNTKFNIKFDLPLTVECKTGSSWANLVKYEESKCQMSQV